MSGAQLPAQPEHRRNRGIPNTDCVHARDGFPQHPVGGETPLGPPLPLSPVRGKMVVATPVNAVLDRSELAIRIEKRRIMRDSLVQQMGRL